MLRVLLKEKRKELKTDNKRKSWNEKRTEENQTNRLEGRRSEEKD